LNWRLNARMLARRENGVKRTRHGFEPIIPAKP
jgi:hypothetical protein